MGTDLSNNGQKAKGTIMMKHKKVTPLRAIKLKCLDCCGDSMSEVRACVVTDCSLWYYRTGKKLIGVKREWDTG